MPPMSQAIWRFSKIS